MGLPFMWSQMATKCSNLHIAKIISVAPSSSQQVHFNVHQNGKKPEKMRFLKGLKLSSHDEAKSFKSLHETLLKMFDRTTTTLLFNSAIFFVYLAFSVTLFSIELSTHYINNLQINWQASTYCNVLDIYFTYL